MNTNNKQYKPIIKWAGGKSKIFPQLELKLPSELRNGKIKKYYEPFLGGGSFFFNIIHYTKFDECVISDINEELILFYKVVKFYPEKLLQFLSKFYTEYSNLSDSDKEKYYYDLRTTYNFERFNINYEDLSYLSIPRAAQFIFLNRTCYNGLFRQNLRGEFNVPFGKNYKPAQIENSNLLYISQLLKNVNLKCEDFEAICNDIDSSDTFVYFDPPYKPISKKGGFTNYHKSNFNENDQIRLLNVFNNLDERSVKLMMNNSYGKSSSEIEPITNYYKKYNISYVNSNSTMSSKIEYRKKIQELVITNY
jgi:DNA adenine methylase